MNTLLIRASLLFLLLVAMSGFLHSQIDPTFTAVPGNPLPANTNFRQVIQPDGKIIVYNAPAMFVNGELRSGMFRLNTDGSTDTTFAYNNEGGVGISNIGIAPDGKIILAGSTSPNHAKMVRLNPDGSLDDAFSVLITAVGPPEFTGNWFSVNAVQPDGKVIATHTSWGNIQGTWYSYAMRRYNLDGSIDSSFTSPALNGGHLVSTWALIELLPDSRFYLAITSRSHLGGSMGITRRMADGTADPTYAPFSTTIGGSSFLSIDDLSIASDGGLLATGQLQQTAIGFPPREQLRRFLPDGSSTPGFVSPLVMTAGGVHQLPDGKILYSASGGTVSRPLIRLEANGSVDDTYVLDPNVTGISNMWQVDAMNRPIFLAQTSAGARLVRLLENGSIDPTFNPVLGAVGTTSLVAVQPDGKVLVAGNFTFMNGTARNRFARLNADGSTDASFDPGTGFSEIPRQLLVQPDGKILAVGTFSSYNGTPVSRMVRLNTDGSIDNTFTVTVTGSFVVEALALQPDGKILIGGSFTAVNSENRTGIARLESTGALDMTFNPVLGSPDLKRFFVEPNGQIVIGGQFTSVNGVDRNNLARLEPNGATDLSFQANGLPVTQGLWRQPDGKYLVTSGPSTDLSRRNSDGSADLGFTMPILAFGSGSGLIRDLMLQPDGSMVIAGRFNSVNGMTRWHLTRLTSNGTHIPTFLNTGANLEIFSAVPYSDGKIMVSGSFTWIDNVTRLGVARVDVPEFERNTRFDFDGDGRADIAVYRPSSGVWYQLFSDGSPFGSPVFGLPGDIPVPADYDGDGKTDLAIFRPSTGDWWFRTTSDNMLRNMHYGAPGDIPLPSDVNNDGTDDFVVYRPSTNRWFRLTTTGVEDEIEFGLPGDIPVIGDFDGDGRSDRAVFRPSTGDWWYAASSAGDAFRTAHWGQSGDIPIPADFDGDGKTDFAVYRPSEGGWYVVKSASGSFITMAFGIAEDRPVPADYDGDGNADIAVFRPSTGIWYVLRSTAGMMGAQWGVATDSPIPGAFLP